jgi:hypothetical protein
LNKPGDYATLKFHGTGPFLSWLMERGVEPHVPVLERKRVPSRKWLEFEGGVISGLVQPARPAL